MKRFWSDVTVDAGLGVRLDGRPVRTPGRLTLVLPNPALAEAVAEEWRAVEGDVDPRTMSLTGLANAAIERVAPDPAAFAAQLAAYGESDLLCYRADSPPDLVARQNTAWNPPLDWAEGRYAVQFELATGVMHRSQPAATVARLGEAIATQSAFALAPLAPIVTITGSLVLGLALAEGAMTAQAVWAAANLDEDWQAEKWGEDDLAAKARETRRNDFDAAARFLGLAA